MTKLFLDCEFNGFGGELIAIALVDEHQHFFYEVLPCPQPIPWVQEHVIPYLNQTAISLPQLQKKLQHFLAQYDQIEIIADWPEDFALLMRCLILAPGQSMYLPDFSMQLWMNQQTEQHVPSVQPHNALSDAQALQRSYFAVNSAK